MIKVFRFLLRGVYRLLKTSAVLVFGGIALLILVGAIASLFQTREQIFIADGTALEVALEGFVVEELQPVSPVQVLGLGGNVEMQTRLHDVTKALSKAAEDDRIGSIVLRLDRFFGASPAALSEIGAALRKVKAAEKPIYAYGDFYLQPHYVLASYADEIALNPAGFVSLEGYGQYPLYLREALDKLDVTVNTFKAGTFKAAVEPYTRSDMSEAAREANQAFLGDLWASYLATITENRGADNTLAAYVNDPLPSFKQAGGQTAQWALNSGLVDSLKTRPEMRSWLAERAGGDEEDYSALNYRRYLMDILPQFNAEADTVAVLYASGEILDGEQPPGTVGGNTLASLIKRAADTDSIKAIVLRVDSPGGSAFASEIIRQELAAARDAGKVVVASFGGYAASGGYWISTAAQEIIAHRETVTGSIGVFMLVPSFEKTLDKWGIQSDGVGTTPLTGAVSLTRGISPVAQDMLQLTVERTYQDFLQLVAEARSMDVEAVDAVAQGRVWSGKQGEARGLVDSYGTLETAIERAAELAQLEDYNRIVLREGPTPVEQVLQQLQRYLGVRGVQAPSPTLELLSRAQEELDFLTREASANSVQARCLDCLGLAP